MLTQAVFLGLSPDPGSELSSHLETRIFIPSFHSFFLPHSPETHAAPPHRLVGIRYSPSEVRFAEAGFGFKKYVEESEAGQVLWTGSDLRAASWLRCVAVFPLWPAALTLFNSKKLIRQSRSELPATSDAATRGPAESGD